MSTIQTAPLCGHAVQFSPFAGNQLAFAGAENYGIAGKWFVNYEYLIIQKSKKTVCLFTGAGACVVFERDPSGAWQQIKKCVVIVLSLKHLVPSYCYNCL